MEHIHINGKSVILFTDSRGLSLTKVLAITEIDIKSIISYKTKEVIDVEGFKYIYMYSSYTICIGC